MCVGGGGGDTQSVVYNYSYLYSSTPPCLWLIKNGIFTASTPCSISLEIYVALFPAKIV